MEALLRRLEARMDEQAAKLAAQEREVSAPQPLSLSLSLSSALSRRQYSFHERY